MALGRILAASLASPAATPTISVPPKAKMTPSVRATTAGRPSGKKPPLSAMLCRPAGVPSTGAPVTIAQIATSMKATMAATLMRANQNSASPNILTLSILSTKTRARAMRASTHCGIHWKELQ